MVSTKCYSCKNLPWIQCCDCCLGKSLLCFIFKKTIAYREKHDYMRYHYSDPYQYLICKKCNINKHISKFRFKHYICRSCTRCKRRRPSIYN